ncbi:MULTISPECIES: glutamate synthase subunit beta [Cryobacterium]|uniref:Glutamate synthase subunit beta n=1 Tax=Cryobacterium zongtaii TaxID=1259217 RepID=A0A2S3Z860_9MICO|nr:MULTISPECIES: glutamate synthase subunit beta [Cryobacterium]ASD22203.1 glutamate synthase [Cryobacterium sp. LW097]MEC5182750.1 glutamate synthase (NADPH/NADH) small chain [Cryobacterium sp. MP_3.1]POH61734.1 glutamate synthase subunit beta [Cryobacterium zongtaii]POH65498.1 glutamate synthase subunit beta [Cryobacterium zongtaii]POH67417.1 glutamate synthase subunit beta [Cryobacterium zongtaii]
MADPKGFLKTTDRELPARRPVSIRLMDWKEVYEAGDSAVLKRQAGRCMDCGVPFCHQGCPLGNLIPEWNDLTWRDEGRQAIERLHATNNFPEFTGRLCPAPCESACVLGINQPAVTIKQVEVSIIDQAFAEGWVTPQPPGRLTGKTIAVVGSGPAGLAAAQQLTRAGHTVAVFERDDRIGGLLRYGIPDFKMEKKHLDLRLSQMTAEGTRFRAGVNIGVDITWTDLRARYDAVVIATGAMVPRDLPIPGRDLPGVHFAMEYLVQQNKVGAGDTVDNQILAEGKHVVVLGGGDTGADCIGTANRQLAASVTNLAIGKQPGDSRPEHQPWPMSPTLFEVSSAHEEGGTREYLASTIEFLANDAGEVRAIRVAETEYLDGRRVPKAGTEREIPADLVLLALGFTGPDSAELTHDLHLPLDDRSNVVRDSDYQTSHEGVFVAGDAGRGQSLIVWAIAEGRAAAAAVDRYLEGETQLPAPVKPTDHSFAI